VTVVPAAVARRQKAATHPSAVAAAVGNLTWVPISVQPDGVGIWAAAATVAGTQIMATTTKMSFAWWVGMVTVGTPLITPAAIVPCAWRMGAAMRLR